MKVAPFHSKHHRAVRYHTSNKCGLGSEIPRKNKVSGTGGLTRCDDCASLNKQGR